MAGASVSPGAGLTVLIPHETDFGCVQANLGLKRARQCEEFLGLASWLALKEPTLTTNLMQSQLSRLFGQLYAMEVSV